MIGWTKIISFSKIQFIVALSSMEVEYVFATVLSKELIWLQTFMDHLGKKQRLKGYTVITRVSFMFQRTQHFILRGKIDRSITISYNYFYKMENWSSKRYTLARILHTC